MLRIIYIFFTGLLLAVFIGVGIAAFYPGPEMPEYPTQLEYRTVPDKDGTLEETPEQRDARMRYDADFKVWEELNRDHSRNVSIMSILAALAYMALGLTLAERLPVIADGLLLGGLFTLVYSVIQGFVSEDNAYRFVVVSVGLVIALGLGYVKFVKPHEKRKR